MAKGVEQIEQDIAVLEQAVVAIAQEFYDTYHQYLSELGQAVRQQLIQAGYHLCTRGCPERFLQLSLNQRQQLQQSLQQLAKQAKPQLLGSLQFPSAVVDEPDSPEVLIASDSTDALAAFNLLLDDREEQPVEPEPEPEPEPEKSTEESPDRPMNPVDLAKWQDRLEKLVGEELQTISHAANCLLQQSNILPRQLPEPVLEVAAKSDLAGEAAGPPNLLNLLIEAEGGHQQESSVTHIVAIRLRLSEIEFANPTLSSWRSNIRSLSNRLGQLGQEYQKKQREKAIAEAEAAWRSSWYEDPS
ncbi:hypothetical protein IQ268_00750 [Oculatella sp. LEGE 06141]|uniref:hypothetical protein n=1 Tax=Oculatella sp. LEGE 06141 TaxID=1828648 RepID=UPI00187E0E70|nr:hypothetical protein [Oculatella sp. LEGE 06141]MBE9177103.1 hypothetical protein [Oculatella sp. LEGE 06141]